MLNSSADIDLFFQTADFAETVAYTPEGGSPANIPVIFDMPYALTSVQGVTYQNAHPTCLAKTSDVSTATSGATIVRGAVTYYVVDVQPDGTGITNLVLSTQAP